MSQDKEFSTGGNDWDSENVSCRAGRWNKQYHRRTAHCWKREIMSFPAMCGTPTADANCSPRSRSTPNVQYRYRRALNDVPAPGAALTDPEASAVDPLNAQTRSADARETFWAQAIAKIGADFGL